MYIYIQYIIIYIYTRIFLHFFLFFLLINIFRIRILYGVYKYIKYCKLRVIWHCYFIWKKIFKFYFTQKDKKLIV